MIYNAFMIYPAYEAVAKILKIVMLKSMRVAEPEIFARNLLRLRRSKQWSQKDLADKLNVHQTVIARWESGKTVPRGDSVERLAELFAVPITDLIADPAATAQNGSACADVELSRLFGHVNSFEHRDREALKAFLEAIIMKNRVKSAINQAS